MSASPRVDDAAPGVEGTASEAERTAPEADSATVGKAAQFPKWAPSSQPTVWTRLCLSPAARKPRSNAPSGTTGDRAWIDSLAHGEGVGRLGDGGYVVFVSGGLPGDRVRAVVVKRKRSYAHARMVEVLEESPERIAPTAKHPGVAWQVLPYERQLQIKQEQVDDALRRIGRLEGSWKRSCPRSSSGAIATSWSTRLALDFAGGLIACRRSGKYRHPPGGHRHCPGGHCHCPRGHCHCPRGHRHCSGKHWQIRDRFFGVWLPRPRRLEAGRADRGLSACLRAWQQGTGGGAGLGEVPGAACLGPPAREHRLRRCRCCAISSCAKAAAAASCRSAWSAPTASWKLANWRRRSSLSWERRRSAACCGRALPRSLRRRWAARPSSSGAMLSCQSVWASSTCVSPRKRSSRRTPRWPRCCTGLSPSTRPWRVGSACTTSTAGSARLRSRWPRVPASSGGSR